jgi:hypothetical protein
MVRFLASMKFAFWSITALILWFLTGTILASASSYAKTFAQMNDVLIVEWFFHEAQSDSLVMIWFVVFCFFALLVAISFAFCTSVTLYKVMIRQSFELKQIVLFLMHVVFIGIMGFHLLSMVGGYKRGYIPAFEGQMISINENCSLIVRKIHFVDDPSVLRKKDKHSKIRLSKENFSIEENYVEVAMIRSGEIIGAGNIYFLKPLVINRYWFTIESFIIDEHKETPNIGARLVIARNPVLIPFFVMYGLAILLILIWTILTWNGIKSRD